MKASPICSSPAARKTESTAAAKKGKGARGGPSSEAAMAKGAGPKNCESVEPRRDEAWKSPVKRANMRRVTRREWEVEASTAGVIWKKRTRKTVPRGAVESRLKVRNTERRPKDIRIRASRGGHRGGQVETHPRGGKTERGTANQ